jgi:hypothetical protein
VYIVYRHSTVHNYTIPQCTRLCNTKYLPNPTLECCIDRKPIGFSFRVTDRTLYMSNCHFQFVKIFVAMHGIELIARYTMVSSTKTRIMKLRLVYLLYNTETNLGLLQVEKGFSSCLLSITCDPVAVQVMRNLKITIRQSIIIHHTIIIYNTLLLNTTPLTCKLYVA